MAKLVSKVYGEALFEVAMENPEKAPAMLDEISAITEILDSNPEFDKLMKHPGISKSEKLETVDQVFGGKCSPEVSGFMKTLVEKERYGSIHEIFEYFTAKVKDAEGIGVASVTTAVEINEKQKSEIVERLLETTGFKKMEMTYYVDPTLIGGMTIRIGDRVVDSSVQTKLQRLKNQLLQIQLKQ